jgi:hypothetical protein
MALERAHVWRKQAEADRAAAVAVIDAVDQRRELLAPVIVGREQVRLMLAGGHQVEQHDADAQRLVPRDLQAISSIEHTRPVDRTNRGSDFGSAGGWDRVVRCTGRFLG